MNSSYYTLQRCYTKPFGYCQVAVFDLWDYINNTGFEIHVILSRTIPFSEIQKYIGHTASIAAWNDAIIKLKGMKLNDVYGIH